MVPWLGWKKNQYETQAKSQKFVNDIFMMRIELNFKWSWNLKLTTVDVQQWQKERDLPSPLKK